MSKGKPRESFKRKRSAFREFYYSMILLGIIIGAIIPLFISELATTQVNMERMFFLFCIGVGMLIGLANYGIFKIFIQKELKRLKSAMDEVGKLSYGGVADVKREDYTLEVSSADLIGEVQESFNEITDNILTQLELSEQIKQFQESLAKEMELEVLSYTIAHQFLKITKSQCVCVYAKIGENLKLVGKDGLDSPFNFVKESNELLKLFSLMKETKIIEYKKLGDVPIEFFDGNFDAKYSSTHIRGIPIFERNGSLIGLIVMCGQFEEISNYEKKKLFHYLYHTALYFQNVLLHTQLIEIAEIDGLTQVYNRMFGMKYIEEAYKWVTMKGKEMSIIMLDIDFFKKINDTYGHACGDFVLKETAVLLSEDLRTRDIVCRYGGEEFLIALEGSDLENSVKIAERIRHKIEVQQFKYLEDSIKVSVSIGLTNIIKNDEGCVECAIKFADKALYVAKGKGKNRTIVYDKGEFQTIEGY
ncbi:MAG: GGDEF domain-containing protein [Fusobacteria bacterium]|nr:GGDEF domain-containing protein [Fusobacteriota bacterium]